VWKRATDPVILDFRKKCLVSTTAGEDGQIHFYNDVHERDQKILTALDSPYRVNIPESWFGWMNE
jgi:hypothetical protein